MRKKIVRIKGIIDPDPATTISPPTDDAYIDESVPDANRGSRDDLEIDDKSGEVKRIFIRFDLSGIPSGATINLAKVRLYYYDYDDRFADPAGKQIDIHRVLGSWDEDTITWNNAPSYVSNATSSINMPSSYGWVEWTVTDDVQGMINGDYDNYGWCIKAHDETHGPRDKSRIFFYSKEYDDYDPELYIEYTLPPEVSTNPASNVTAISANLNGSVDAINDSEIVERGFEWGTESGSYPYSWTETGSFGAGSFNHDLGDLQPNTTYYYRAKAKNNNGNWGYGDEVSFTTLSGIPSVSTLDPDIDGQNVTMKGEVTDLNGSPDVSERGFEWGMKSGNYDREWTEAGSFPAEQFSHQETPTSWVTYYYRAKAKGVGGWGYGEERSFVTYEPGYGMIYFPSSKKLNLDLSWAKWMRLYLYGDHTEDFTIKIRLHQDAENYFEGSLTVKAGEWRKYEISMDSLSQVGSPNLSNINWISIISPHILLIDSDFVFLSAVRELMRVKFTLKRDSPSDESPKIKFVKIIWREGA